MRTWISFAKNEAIAIILVLQGVVCDYAEIDGV